MNVISAGVLRDDGSNAIAVLHESTPPPGGGRKFVGKARDERSQSAVMRPRCEKVYCYYTFSSVKV